MQHYFADSMTTTSPEPKHKIVFASGMVTLQQRKANKFAVRYGKEVHAALTYNEACTKLGAALMHQAACDGLLDNS